MGGSSVDEGRGIAVDTAGGAYVTGSTNSGDFPATPGGFDTSAKGSRRSRSQSPSRFVPENGVQFVDLGLAVPVAVAQAFPERRVAPVPSRRAVTPPLHGVATTVWEPSGPAR